MSTVLTIIVPYFWDALWRGFVAGVAIRFLIALYTKTDMTWGGLVRTGIFFSIVNMIMKWIMVS